MLKKFFLLILWLIFFKSLSFGKDLKLVITVELLSEEPSLFYIEKVEVMDEEGKTFSLLSEKKKIEIEKNPFILLDTKIPTANYREVILKVWSNFKEKIYRFNLEALKQDDLVWISLYQRVLPGGEVELVKRGPTSYVRENALFITMKGSELIGVYDRVSGKLLDLFYIPNGMEELAKSYKYNYLYGVIPKKNTLTIIDLLKKNRVFIDLKRGSWPISLASTVLNDGRELIFIANYKSNTITVVDGDSWNEIKTLEVGNGPVKVWVDPPPEKIKNISQPVYQYLLTFRNLYCLNLYSGTFMVFKLNAQNGEILGKSEYFLGSKPVNLFVDYENGLVYIINQGANYINTGFITALVDNPISLLRFETGEFGIIEGVYHPRLKQVILLKASPAELIFGRSPLTGQQYLNQFIVMDRLNLKGEPVSLALDEDLSKLYIVDKKTNKLYIYDFYSKKIFQDIYLFQDPGKILIW